MRSFDVEIEDGQKVVAHCDGDYTGRAIWTIVENNERIVEVEADIEDVQYEVGSIESGSAMPKHVMVGDKTFPYAAICTILEGFAAYRIMYLMEDKIYDLKLLELLEIEKTWKNKGTR